MKTRIEKDSLGEVEIPYEAYYGIYTHRSKENFQITKRGLSRQMIKALANVKKACARANQEVGLMDEKCAEAISLSCDEILNGRLHGQFITDLIQGGAGLGINMNANEVIANRANEMLGGEKGKYEFVDPIKDVNLNQSTNEVILAAGKITTIRLVKKLIVEGKKMVNCLNDKIDNISQLKQQTEDENKRNEYLILYQEFNSYAHGLEKAIKRIDDSLQGLLEITLGYTTSKGREYSETFMKKVVKNLKQQTGDNFSQSKSPLDGTRNFDPFVMVSSTLKGLSVNLGKIASDLRVLSMSTLYTQPPVVLPVVQAATNSVYDKDFPVVLDMVNQVSFYTFGSDSIITLAAGGNQLDLNMYAPILLSTLFETTTYIRRAMRTFREKCLEGIKFN